MTGTFSSFSSKIASKRFIPKKHSVTYVSFYATSGNTINLVVNTDDRQQQIRFKFEQAEELLKKLSDAIESFKDIEAQRASMELLNKRD